MDAHPKCSGIAGKLFIPLRSGTGDELVHNFAKKRAINTEICDPVRRLSKLSRRDARYRRETAAHEAPHITGSDLETDDELLTGTNIVIVGLHFVQLAQLLDRNAVLHRDAIERLLRLDNVITGWFFGRTGGF